MAEHRRGAYAAGAFTAAAYLVAPLLAPGPLTAARGVAILVAFWLGWAAWRLHGRESRRAALPYRVAPTAPGLIAVAAAIGLVAVLAAAAGGPDSLRLDAALLAAWSFPFSPVEMYARDAAGLAPASATAVRAAAATLSAAVTFGCAVGFLALIGPVSRRPTLRRHALLWKGAPVEDAARRLSDRGARGLRPVADPLAGLAGEPVTGRLWLRAVSLLLAALCLAYAPVFSRLLGASHLPPVEAALAWPPLADGFAATWLISLWATGVAAALIYAAAYLRLGFVLSR